MRRETKLERETRRWQAGEITKWAFYESTKWYPAAEVARVAGVPVGVVRMRRRDLRAMADRRLA